MQNLLDFFVEDVVENAENKKTRRCDETNWQKKIGDLKNEGVFSKDFL